VGAPLSYGVAEETPAYEVNVFSLLIFFHGGLEAIEQHVSWWALLYSTYFGLTVLAVGL